MWRYASVPVVAAFVLSQAGGGTAAAHTAMAADSGGGWSVALPGDARRQAATAQRVSATLEPRALFNKPTGSRQQREVISRHIRRLIRGASPGSAINVSLFHFISRSMASEFIRAKRRGVQVKIVLNGDSRRYRAVQMLRRGLGRDTRRRSWVLLCKPGRGCIAPRWRGQGRAAINHNKYFLFSKTSGYRNVVVQASGNLTWWAEAIQWNNAVTLADGRIYDGYLRYFWDQARQFTTPDYRRMVVSGNAAAQFFPRSHDDPVLSSLNAVSCTGGTKIRIGMGYFTWLPVARRLRALTGAGCQVEMVATGIGTSAARVLTRRGMWGHRPEIRHTPEGRAKTLEHSKYMLIDGTYLGRRQRVVFTGSNNYTGAGFRKNDEALLTIVDDRLHDSYLRNFRTVWRIARPFSGSRVGKRSIAVRPGRTHGVVADDADERD